MAAAKSSDTKRSLTTPHAQPLAALRSKPLEQKRSTKTWAAFFCAAVLGLGTAATWLWSPSSADQVSDTERQQRAVAFAQRPALRMKSVAGADLNSRIAAMQLQPAAEAQLKQALQAQPGPAGQFPPLRQPAQDQLKLSELTVWDTHASDGDIIRVASAGYSRDVVLQKQPLILAVPVLAGSPIHIIGVHDGGGGITLGVQVADRSMMLPIMSEGQTLALPVAR